MKYRSTFSVGHHPELMRHITQRSCHITPGSNTTRSSRVQISNLTWRLSSFRLFPTATWKIFDAWIDPVAPVSTRSVPKVRGIPAASYACDDTVQ